VPVAIEFFLDEPSAAAIREVWRALAEPEISPYLHTSGVRPHLTLLSGEAADLAALTPRLRDLAAATPPVTVSFVHLGLSPGPAANLFLVPRVTPDLLALHARYHAALAGLLTTPSERARPGQWVPHCTLVERVAAERLAAAVEVCRRAPLPLAARLAEIGVVEWRPVRQHCAFALGRGEN
jgi:2'-5' RNA ligase